MTPRLAVRTARLLAATPMELFRDHGKKPTPAKSTKRNPRMELLENRCVLAAYQNPLNALDVNGDAFVSPIDALLVINLLNSKSASTPVAGLPGPPPFVDVDGDDFVSPRDALQVADFINNRNDEGGGGNTNLIPLEAQLTFSFFAVGADGSLGRNLDPNPNDTNLEALVGVGEKFIVRTLVRDLRADPKGVYSTYSDFNYTNADGSSSEKIAFQATTHSQNFSNGKFGYLEDLTSQVAGKRVLRQVGGFSIFFQPGASASSLLDSHDILFTANTIGVINIAETISSQATYKLGVSGLSGTGDYATESKIRLPTATINVVDPIRATNDTFSIVEDSAKKSFNVLANDIDLLGTSRGVVTITQPAVGGTVTVTGNGTSVDFVPATNFFGQVQFTYTAQNNLGNQAIGTVTINVLPVNDVPTLDPIADLSLLPEAPPKTILITGISAGPGESQKLRLSATSSDTSIVLNPTIDYTSPNPTASLTIQRVADTSNTLGENQITVTVVDEEGLQTQRSFVVLATAYTKDFGDAPSSTQSGFTSSYPTKLADNGANHERSTLYLGSVIDAESDGFPNNMATGDDANRLADEDGVSFPISHKTSATVPTASTFVATASESGFVDAWVDFNQDGDWDDVGESIVTKIAVSAGRNIVPFVIPAGSTNGRTYARFRLSRVGGLLPTGPAADGEVEDMAIFIEGATQLRATLRIADLGTPAVSVSNGKIVITVGAQTVWSVPANEISILAFINESGETIRELTDFATAPPDVVRYSEMGTPIALQVVSPILNLASFGAAAIQGVNSIDLRQSGSNVLTFGIEDVKKINNQQRVQVSLDVEDKLSTTPSWIVGMGRVENGNWIQPYVNSSRDTTLEIVSARPWRNEVQRLDTDGDTTISPLDALILINGINGNTFPNGALPNRLTSSPAGFYDPDGDNRLGPLDVLSVINRLNQGAGSGEGELSKLAYDLQSIATDMLFSKWAYASDLDHLRHEVRPRYPIASIRLGGR